LGDIHPTPVAAAMPGVLVQAELIDALLADQWLTRPSWALTGELLTLMLVLGLVSFAVSRLPAWGAAAALVAIWAILWAGSLLLFAQYGWLVDVSLATLVSAVLAAVVLTQSYARSAGERRWIRRAFAHYLPAPLVDELAQHPERLQLRGEIRELTLMFCDLRGFTSLCETCPPGPLGELMNQYLTALSSEVMEHGGTIDKYIGDCIMAFWNAPLEAPDHARLACRAALAMRRRMSSLNAELRAAGLLAPAQTLAMGIGLHTGPAAVGNFGSRQRFTYTALGDTVNLAARLESLCKDFGVDIVLSEATRSAGAAACSTRVLGEVQVKGRATPVLVHTLVDEADESPAGCRG
jgi:adenylate cyclase